MSKALIGRQAIMSHLNISKAAFYDLVAAGMPVEYRGVKSKRWVGHADELDAWFCVGCEVCEKQSEFKTRG